MNKYPYVGIVFLVIVVCAIIFVAGLFPKEPTTPTYKIGTEPSEQTHESLPPCPNGEPTCLGKG